MLKRSLIDRAVEYFSPRTAAIRYYARYQLKEFEKFEKRRFEAGSKGRRTEGWRSPGGDANSAFDGSLSTLRNRSRDLVRNNPYAKRAVQIISANVVGRGIKGEITDSNKRRKDKFEQIWKQWAETTKCDADGKNNLYGLQKLACRSIVEGGGVLIRKRRRSSSSKLPVPLQIQLLEPDYIDTYKQGKSGDNYIFQGIEYNSQNEVVAYWIFDEHPGNNRGLLSLKSRRVSSSELLYIYRVDRIGQSHGVPWGVSVFIRLKDFDDYEDAQLVRQKIAACFTAFIYDANGNTTATGLDKVKGSDSELVDKFEPGSIEILPPGKQVTLASPPGVQNYGEYSSAQLHGIASGYDVPYEAVTGDYSQVNYSSSRMAWLQFGRDIDDWQFNMMIPQFCNPIYEWFSEALSVSVNSMENTSIKWITPRRELLDPTKEIPAKIKEIRGGLTSRKRALREMGHDPDDINQEIEEDNKVLDEKGIILDSDPRHVTAGGTLQKQEEEDNAEDE